MEKNIKDYLHLYLGCDCTFYHTTMNRQLTEKLTHALLASAVNPLHNVLNLKLILRKLDSMTEEEAREFCIKEGWGENLENIVVLDGAIEFQIPNQQGGITQAVSRFTRCRPEMFRWLLNKGFDLFDLLPSNLAIDKNK